MNAKRQKSLEVIINALDGKTVVTRKEIHEAWVREMHLGPLKSIRWVYDDYRVGHGKF